MNNKLTLKLDLRMICIVLLVIILGMLALWRPWEGSTDRTISTTGQTEVRAEPDEFIFYPRFERTGEDTAALKEELNGFGIELQTKLKELGVKEENITLDSSSYDYGPARPEDQSKPTVTLGATITVSSRELAQKVQDYLATTDAKGQLTAQSRFSANKRQELEDQARDKAVEDARAKAERTAESAGTRIGKVIEIRDIGSGFGVGPSMRGDSVQDGSAGLPVTPGMDTVTFRVEVVFELR